MPHCSVAALRQPVPHASDRCRKTDRSHTPQIACGGPAFLRSAAQPRIFNLPVRHPYIVHPAPECPGGNRYWLPPGVMNAAGEIIVSSRPPGIHRQLSKRACPTCKGELLFIKRDHKCLYLVLASPERAFVNERCPQPALPSNGEIPRACNSLNAAIEGKGQSQVIIASCR